MSGTGSTMLCLPGHTVPRIPENRTTIRRSECPSNSNGSVQWQERRRSQSGDQPVRHQSHHDQYAAVLTTSKSEHKARLTSQQDLFKPDEDVLYRHSDGTSQNAKVKTATKNPGTGEMEYTLETPNHQIMLGGRMVSGWALSPLQSPPTVAPATQPAAQATQPRRRRSLRRFLPCGGYS